MEDMIGTALGWIGTVGTLSAYILITRGTVSPTGKRYAALNMIGGTFAAAGALAFGAWPAFFSNVVWAGIGLHGLVTATRRARHERKLSLAANLLTMPTPTEFAEALLKTQPIAIMHPQAIRLPTQEELLAASRQAA
ncbi:hypothetical protein JSO19_07410 [Leucobacter sp. UCMA 4100]|uniref:CBU_0592 family membrane protein n=1 Tax=Leucobacter sp. UCMA 4100 TaxID=2810534 RepID=UPI0022EA98DF|nr:hypothetical protein [Leucobacter sp. UCMA 4100]MDA3147205.1 hypothetical protein [Leucobacter sp. UCMA 4100]